MKRLFCAIKVPASNAMREAFYTFGEALSRERINWVDPQNLHFTIKFFGDTPTHMERDIIRVLHQAAEHVKPFEFDLAGCGFFGHPKSPRVLWMGASQAGGLVSLYKQVNKQLKPLGYTPDKDKFIPHLTIGRIKQIDQLALFNQLLVVYQNTHFAHVKTDRFYLFQSTLKPTGPEYKIIETFNLNA